MKLNNRRTLFVGFAFLSISAFWQLYDNIIPLILTKTFSLGDAITGYIMAADNILALFLLPLFGSLSDRVNTKLGKRTPFILSGTFLAVVMMFILAIANNAKNLNLFMIALAIALIAMGTYRSPAVALMPDVTPKPLRSKANAIINLMGSLGGVTTLVLIMFLVNKGDHPNYLPLFATVAGIMILAVSLLVLNVKENKIKNEMEQLEINKEEQAVNTTSSNKLPADVKRSLTYILFSISLWFMGYNAVISAYSRYAANVFKMEGGGFASPLLLANITAIIAFIPIGYISSKLGRKKVILFGVSLLALCFFALSFFRSMNFMIYIPLALVGIAWASINVNSYPMVVEMSKVGDVGKYTGIYYTFSMSAQILTPILSGYLLQYVGYWTLFPYATLCVILAFVTMMQVKHGDNKPELVKGLKAYDIED
ncbi:MAG: MFS transporter [Erysipelotrichaceae bacterium]|nr:MFS transporter [Erysipelotrichaceae bacterium]MDD3924407.1 MFS transporter [Erysipelotrichaceae bacterium]MDD4642867.1 MFS transporter [Erysipelotrichaceae bacterium]